MLVIRVYFVKIKDKKTIIIKPNIFSIILYLCLFIFFKNKYKIGEIIISCIKKTIK